MFHASGAHHAARDRSSRTMVVVALASDLLIALAKFVVAALTGSSAMRSEGIHSTVDALTEIVLLYGLRASRRPSTARHQFGFGREIYFWNFIVSLMILAVGAGASLLDGIRQYVKPEPLGSPVAIYVVLGFALVAEVASLYGALRAAGLDHPRQSWRRYLRTSRNATSLTVIFGSVSGMLGLMVAAIGTGAAIWLEQPRFDGVASIVIALILAATAVMLARNSKDLLIGLPAAPSTADSILSIAAAHALVERANGLMSVHLAPDQILVAISVEFVETGTTASIETAVGAIERAIKQSHPEVVICLIKPQSRTQFADIARGRGW
jgi:cation diffusion facilitator family transporter